MTIDLDKVAEFHQQDRDLLRVKNAAYGNTGLRQTGMEGIATRVIDKANRLLNLSRNPDLDQGDEAIDDTLRDISNYGILGRMLDDKSLLNRPASIYLAGPIDLAPPGLAEGWRTIAKNIFGHYSVATFDPNAAWGEGVQSSEVKAQIMAIDYFAILNCGMVMAYLPYDVPTLGTVREIEFARSQDKRVVVASPWAQSSAFSADLECYPNLWEAFCGILEIDEADLTDLVLTIFAEREVEDLVGGFKGTGEDHNDNGNSDSGSYTKPVTHRRMRVGQD
jgi:hypothetical protein